MDSLYPGDELTIQRSTSALTVVTVEKLLMRKSWNTRRNTRSPIPCMKAILRYPEGVRLRKTGGDRPNYQGNGEVVGRDVLETETIKKAVKRIVGKEQRKFRKPP